MKKLTITATIMLILICITAGSVQAVFQSIPDATAATYTAANWLLKVRQMEASGQVMGLRESLASTSTLLPSSSNGVDVHLQKNTEYGAMLILAVSDYGKQGNGTDGSDHINDSTYGLATTTGNETGVYQVGSSYESVAAGEPYNKATVTLALYNANSRYRDSYLKSTLVSKSGDSLNIYNWQGNTGTWLSGSPSDGNTSAKNSKYYLLRKSFSYNSMTYTGTATGRAVMVNGTGF